MAPYFFSKYCYQQAICDRVDNLWRIHQNRKKKGMGGTAHSSQLYTKSSGHNMDSAFVINNGVHLSMNAILTGQCNNLMYNNPFVRFNKDLAAYAHDHTLMDDIKLYKTDNFERIKPRMPKEGSTVGTANVLPI